MTSTMQGRESTSPYVKHIWRGRIEKDYSPICPASTHWNLLFVKHRGNTRILAEGALTHSLIKDEFEGSAFLVIQLELGVYMPHLPPGELVDNGVHLPEATSRKFWLKSSSYQIPEHEHVEGFVQRLIRDGVLVQDKIVNDVLKGHTPDMSERTIRRRFLHTTGMTLNTIRQIDQARSAAVLLEQNMPILDAALEAGYADQPHLTRALRRYFGRTPLQIAQVPQPVYCPICSRRGLFVDLCYWCKTMVNAS